jgi:2-dehydro-3-deoxyphosphogalactonate aldolase
MVPYVEKGAAGFGIGAALYTPDLNIEQISSNAKLFVHSFKQAVHG